MKRIEKQKVQLLSIAVAAFAVAGVLACRPGSATNEDTTTRVNTLSPENIALVMQGELQSGPVISGSLAPEREATVRAEIGGPVLATSADQGQRVARGELLARIDDAEIQVTYLSARSAVSAAENSASVAKREEDRAVALAAAGAISERDLDNAKRANVAAQAQLADARSRLALMEKQRSATRIVAPFDGVISEKQVSAGDVVQPGNALFTLIDPRSMRLEAMVPADELSRMKTGATVNFTVSGYGTRAFAGRVTRVNPAADPATGQVRIFVSIPNSGQTLVSGLFAEGRVALETRTALLAPTGAVNTSGLAPTVMRVKNGAVEKVDVTIGASDPTTERIEILTGVAVGDTLLVGAAQGLLPGTRVRMGSASDAPASGSSR